MFVKKYALNFRLSFRLFIFENILSYYFYKDNKLIFLFFDIN